MCDSIYKIRQQNVCIAKISQTITRGRGELTKLARGVINLNSESLSLFFVKARHHIKSRRTLPKIPGPRGPFADLSRHKPRPRSLD